MATTQTQKLLAFRVSLTKNGKKVQSRTLKSRTRLINFVQGRLNSELISADGGTVRVIYNSDKDYWNEFEFNNMAELKERIAPCVEPKLVKDYN